MHNQLLAPVGFEWSFRYVIFKLILVIMAEVSLMKLPTDICHWTLWMIGQHWFLDLCLQMASLGHNELNCQSVTLLILRTIYKKILYLVVL